MTIDLRHGDCLEIMRTLPDGCVDAVVTDPPYSSGGFTRGDRTATTTTKYVYSTVVRNGLVHHSDFSGDNRDQRSWGYWCALWISECLRLVKPHGYFLMFTDWRQLPVSSDVIQAGGFVWRGVVVWDKTQGARAAHTGYFRHQCEYVVWGTKGVSTPATWGGPWPGCIRLPVLQSDKFHLTGKPTPLLTQLVQCCPPNGTVFDPFSGSGTTGVACVQTGRSFIGIEIDEVYFEIAKRRIEQAQMQTRMEPA